MLRCPKCGGIYEKNDGFTRCFECDCKLITEDEYCSNGYHNSDKPIVECPYCHSKNTKKIGAGERAVSVIGLGLLSKKINKSFKCKNCGGTF